jgi:hypothetical protein
MGIRSYREKRRSLYAITGGLVAAAFISGLVAGILLPEQTATRPSLRESLDALIKKGEDIKSFLELVALEYSQGGGEAEAAKGHLERAMAIFEDVREELEVLNRTGTMMLSDKLQELEVALEAGEAPERVEVLVLEAQLIIDKILNPYRAGGE